MFKVGLTGGIGSGKTTVAGVFEALGVPIYYSDIRAKNLMLRSDLREEIKASFGNEIYTDEGELNRKLLSQIVFSNPSKLQTLNSIVHPAVERDFLEWADRQVAEYVIEEAAVLIESRAHLLMDKIITIEAPIETRIRRVTVRDNTPCDKVEARIAAQITDEERRVFADYVVTNDDKTLLLPQIVGVDERIRKIIISLRP